MVWAAVAGTRWRRAFKLLVRLTLLLVVFFGLLEGHEYMM
jgi:hypothetical protein